MLIGIRDRWSNACWDLKMHKIINRISKMTKANFIKITRVLQLIIPYLATIRLLCSKRATYCVKWLPTGYLTKSMNFFFHSFENHFREKSTGYHCTTLFKTGYLLYKTGHPGLPHKINEFLFWATGLPLYSFVQNGLLKDYLLCKTGYLFK